MVCCCTCFKTKTFPRKIEVYRSTSAGNGFFSLPLFYNLPPNSIRLSVPVGSRVAISIAFTPYWVSTSNGISDKSIVKDVGKRRFFPCVSFLYYNRFEKYLFLEPRVTSHDIDCLIVCGSPNAYDNDNYDFDSAYEILKSSLEGKIFNSRFEQISYINSLTDFPDLDVGVFYDAKI